MLHSLIAALLITYFKILYQYNLLYVNEAQCTRKLVSIYRRGDAGSAVIINGALEAKTKGLSQTNFWTND